MKHRMQHSLGIEDLRCYVENELLRHLFLCNVTIIW